MKNVIITGSTGMIGKLILNECLSSRDVRAVTCLVRKATGIRHAKYHEIIVKDFLHLGPFADVFRNIDVAFYCLGVYTGQVKPDEFRKITVDYTIAFANMLKANSGDATFCFFSGSGAKETSRIMFARDKGAAENYLVKMNFGRLHIFRPAYIYPVEPRKEPNFSYRLLRYLYPGLKVIFPFAVITSTQVSKAMFNVGIYGSDHTILENNTIKKMMQAIS